MSTSRLIRNVLALILIGLSTFAAPVVAAPAPQQQRPARVDVSAWAAAENGGVDVLVQAVGFVDTAAARRLRGKPARTRFVYEALVQNAARTQSTLLAAMRARGMHFESLWITNQVWVRAASRTDMAWLASRSEVTKVDRDVQMRGVLARTALPRAGAPFGVEWGVMRVRAPEVWAQGYTGQGIVVADLDTGVKWDHPALRSKYRGWNGVAAAHDHHWYDAAGHSVGAPQLAPYDDNGHGTHTIGTVLGDDGAGNQIGVAPDARWIGCRNMYNGVGSVARYIGCFQFALAPTDVQGANANPALAADITTNSWGCDPSWGEEGCEVPSALVTATQVLRDAGVMVVAAAGNDATTKPDKCSTVMNAPGTLDQAFSVGATDSADAVAGFSSRGPSTFTGRRKPDVAAPGVGVRSAHGSGYVNLSGTSMATPHVAGVAALLWSAVPELRGDVDETEALLRRTATPLTTAETCGGDAANVSVPNNVFGHGLIDARAAVSEGLRLRDRLEYSAPVVVTGLVDIPLVITYTNTSPATASDVIITATLPVTAQLIGYTPGAVVDGATGDVVARICALPSGASAVLTMTVLPQIDGVLTLTDLRFSETVGGVRAELHEPTSDTVVACESGCSGAASLNFDRAAVVESNGVILPCVVRTPLVTRAN